MEQKNDTSAKVVERKRASFTMLDRLGIVAIVLMSAYLLGVFPTGKPSAASATQQADPLPPPVPEPKLSLKRLDANVSPKPGWPADLVEAHDYEEERVSTPRRTRPEPEPTPKPKKHFALREWQ